MSRKGAELSTETKELIITLSESVKNKTKKVREKENGGSGSESKKASQVV